MKKFIFATLLFFIPAFAMAMTGSQAELQAQQANYVIGNWCSGTMISTKYRLVLTANHCVRMLSGEKRQAVPVSQYHLGKDGFHVDSKITYYGTVLRVNEDTDLAVIQINREGVKFPGKVQIYNGPAVHAGNIVWTYGNPFMLYNTITRGILSNVHRRVTVGDRTYDYFQMDASIAPGNSGGATVNDNGELIGVNDAAMRGYNLALIIPYMSVHQLLDSMCYGDVYDNSKPTHAECEGQ